jgi:hypothetical protein
VLKRQGREEEAPHLPVIKHALREGLASGGRAQRGREAERFAHGQVGLEVEDGRPWALHLLKHVAALLVQHGVDAAQCLAKGTDRQTAGSATADWRRSSNGAARANTPYALTHTHTHTHTHTRAPYQTGFGAAHAVEWRGGRGARDVRTPSRPVGERKHVLRALPHYVGIGFAGLSVCLGSWCTTCSGHWISTR